MQVLAKLRPRRRQRDGEIFDNDDGTDLATALDDESDRIDKPVFL
jgi:hypothetical protein